MFARRSHAEVEFLIEHRNMQKSEREKEEGKKASERVCRLVGKPREEPDILPCIF